MSTFQGRNNAPWIPSAQALIEALECRDKVTADHCRRVAQIAVMLADEMQLPADDRDRLRWGALIHDIGKLGIRETILDKPRQLNHDEFETIKSHTWKGAAILSRVTGMSHLLPLVRNHHERWDGTGYPDRLRGENIPFLVRVLTVADAFDAMTTARPYRDGLSTRLALVEIAANAGSQFDPKCVLEFMTLESRLDGSAIDHCKESYIDQGKDRLLSDNPEVIGRRQMWWTQLG